MEVKLVEIPISISTHKKLATLILVDFPQPSCTFIRLLIIFSLFQGTMADTMYDQVYAILLAEMLIYDRKDASLKAVQLEALVGIYQLRMQHF